MEAVDRLPFPTPEKSQRYQTPDSAARPPPSSPQVGSATAAWSPRRLPKPASPFPSAKARSRQDRSSSPAPYGSTSLMLSSIRPPRTPNISGNVYTAAFLRESSRTRVPRAPRRPKARRTTNPQTRSRPEPQHVPVAAGTRSRGGRHGSVRPVDGRWLGGTFFARLRRF